MTSGLPSGGRRAVIGWGRVHRVSPVTSRILRLELPVMCRRPLVTCLPLTRTLSPGPSDKRVSA